MNLLPKSHEEFSKVEYWNEFFKKRGKTAFEWYGEYPELCGQLLKYLKPKDDVLVVGCGNSTLSMNLYDVGYRSVTSIDISKIVIKQMKEKNKQRRPELIYECMDATAMTYPDGKFSVVLDKGTFDALMPDCASETVDRIDTYLNEIARVLKRGGRYVCITLLQDHILRKLVNYFSLNDFMLRVSRCHEAEAKKREDESALFPVFVLIATKFPGMPHPILELALTDDKILRVSSTQDIVDGVLTAQQSAFVCNTLKKRSIADIGEVTLDLCSPGIDKPRYTIHVLDRKEIKVAKSYVAFIVPLGRDTDWIFGTPMGRQELLKNISQDRLAVVILRRDHTFDSLEKIKEELGPCVKSFSPSGLPDNYTIDFLSLGQDFGKRELRCKGESAISGPYVVEDVLGDEGYTYRRLIFLNNQFIVQSEARLKKVKSRRRGRKKNAVENSESSMEDELNLNIDHGYLACEHHPYICVAVSAVVNLDETNEILVVGLGGGGLCTFLHKCFDKIKITVVDIDEKVLSIATTWFNLRIDARMKVEIIDGVEFMATAKKQKRKFDAIIFDIDNKDTTLGMSCPPRNFLEEKVLEDVIDCLNERGLFILNLVCRDKSLRSNIIGKLKDVFASLVVLNLENHLNKIFVCSKIERSNEDFKNILVKATENLNSQIKSKKLSCNEIMEVSSLLESVSLER